MIYIFTEQVSNRLKYVLDFCFAEKFEEYTLITKVEDWHGLQGIRINYSSQELVANQRIIPSAILFEEGFQSSYLLDFKNEEFLLNDSNDSFAIIFFLISRYEEYKGYEMDVHGRFLSHQHALVRLQKNHIPVADFLVKKLWLELNLDYSFVLKRFELVPSFDIDVAYAYRHKSVLRWVGGLLKFGDFIERFSVLFKLKKDPYDTYSQINAISAQLDRVICFSLLGDRGKYDHNISHKNFAFGSTLRGLNVVGGMGIHPSYNSYLKKEVIKKEIERLEAIVGHEITKSRQHYLRLKIPDSYELLLELGVKRDYTMGFFDALGFRSGTSFPHYFFNLKTNKATDLLLFPFAYMDGTLNEYLKVSPEQAIILIDELMDNVKEVGGVFMCIWHNSTINEQGIWKGWKKVFEHTIEKGGIA